MFKALFCSLLLLGIVLTNGANADISDGLIGWWMFDEGTGTTVADSSGAGHDGFFVDSTPEWVPGMYGTALEFDGTDKVEIPDHADFHLTNAMSVTLWMQPAGEQASSAKLFIKQKSGQYPYSLQYDDTGQGLFATVNASTRYDTAPHIPDFPGDWAHICFTYNGSILILHKDGEEVASVNTSGQIQQNNLSLSIGCRLDYAQNFNGIIDDVRLFNRELSPDEINQIMADAPALSVTDPSPADGATDVPRDVILSWAPVEAATQHDIYFSTDAQAVANADTSDTTGIYRGRLIAGSYTPTEMLEFGETYYWRVDEVGAPPDNMLLKGNIWSFTVELFVYPITKIIATASSYEEGKGPENTVNGSGLDGTGLLHGNISVDTMWLSSAAGPQPTWIQFEFDRIHKLHEMWGWNSNDSLEPVIGLGFKDVTIEYSTDGVEFMTLGSTHEFAQGPGTANYAHNTTIDFGSVAAKFVKLTANSNWKSILNQYGLSEVRFFSVPISARDPKPASGAEDVDLSVTLTWTAGREADKHNVYFSDDYQAVVEGTAFAATVTETSYGPLSLDLGTTYFWRVDEVNDTETPAVWQGDIWDFTTLDSLVVDDFEGYTDDDAAGEAIWQTWIDGFGVPENGSQVGYLLPPYAEQATIHGGLQSMPLMYDNSAAPYSEATAIIDNLTGGRDWTRYGIENLSLWFIGILSNSADPIYVSIANSTGASAMVLHDEPAATQIDAWREWTIPLQAFADQGVGLTDVDRISIGIGNKDNPQPGGSGTIYIDDIRLD
jgi:hypothetical protein